MTQPQHLVDVDAIVEREGRRLRLVEHLDLARDDLDRAGREVVVHRPGGTGRDVADDAQNPLAPHAVRDLESGHLRIDDDLHDARDIAHVEEDFAAVITTARDPSAHGHRSADVAGA